MATSSAKQSAPQSETMPPTTHSIRIGKPDGRPSNWNPTEVKTPTPIMLVTTSDTADGSEMVSRCMARVSAGQPSASTVQVELPWSSSFQVPVPFFALASSTCWWTSAS